jgi:hypothetical protein
VNSRVQIPPARRETKFLRDKGQPPRRRGGSSGQVGKPSLLLRLLDRGSQVDNRCSLRAALPRSRGSWCRLHRGERLLHHEGSRTRLGTLSRLEQALALPRRKHSQLCIVLLPLLRDSRTPAGRSRTMRSTPRSSQGRTQVGKTFLDRMWCEQRMDA